MIRTVKIKIEANNEVRSIANNMVNRMATRQSSEQVAKEFT